MPLPTPTDYRHAIQDPRSALDDEELRGGEVSRDARGLPKLWSGNFASVYRIDCLATRKSWALKCFTREVTARQERYRHIAAALEAAHLPFTVPFVYLERGIQVHGQWYPAVKMEWVEEQTLNRFVEESLEKPKMLRQLLELWPKLAGRLRNAGIAHADLQHGNVLLVPAADGKLALKLIDYDGMYLQALAGTRSGEAGHPNYQHPGRLLESAYNVHVDRFSHLVIFSAVHCLVAGNRDLWRRYNNDENLLFREQDFQAPKQSELFRGLWETNDPNIRALVGRLALACKQPLEEVPWVDQLVQSGQVKALTHAEQQAVSSLMTAGKAVTPSKGPASDAATIKAFESPVATPDVTALTDARPSQKLTGTRAATPDEVAFIENSRMGAPQPSPPHSGLGTVVQTLDGLLRRLVGEENTILHNFLRLAIVVILIAGPILGLSIFLQHRAESARQLAAIEWQTAQLKAEKETAQNKAKSEAAQKKADADAAQINIDFTAAKNAQLRGEMKAFLRGRDKSRLVAWRSAAEMGVPETQWLYGCVLLNGIECDKDPEQAVNWFRKAADRGNAPAQCSLGGCYDEGQGVPQDYAEAVRWYRMAAEQGNAPAQCNLGVNYQEGQGVSRDYAEAVKWYRMAAEQGNVQAQCDLGCCYQDGHGVSQDYTEAMRWFRKSAQQGYAPAQCQLGILYGAGWGVPQDNKEAVKWLRMAAEQGDAQSQFNLGISYNDGQGVSKNDAEAANWYRKAAEQGLAQAQCVLALCYHEGHGVPKNEVEAVNWLRKAAKQGYAPALDTLRAMGIY